LLPHKLLTVGKNCFETIQKLYGQNQMRIFLAILSLILLGCKPSNQSSEIKVTGLDQAVEVIHDTMGINHIYAQTEHDLFFAQGYCAARDRLFQFEIWRRQASGTVAEILGERELERDIGTRLFKFRGDLRKEFSHYHPQGESIIKSFTDGINAYIMEARNNPVELPLEFKLLGIQPEFWTPELVISRHQGLLGNITEEVNTGRAVALLGQQRVMQFQVFEPGVPNLELDASIDGQGLFEDVIGIYNAYRKPLTFEPQDLLAHYNSDRVQFDFLTQTDNKAYEDLMNSAQRSIGSNNWIVSGSLSSTGYPLLANDPHRALSVPSLRYMVHLNAPGWNVVGGGEPTIPGVSIGHNENGAWGLTVFDIDGEDLMVYELNPQNPDQYKFKGTWENMMIIPDTIRVKNKTDVYVMHRYTRHGPVTFIDKKRNRAYAIRCAWLEPGGAPYLASLRMNTATTWEEFREACSYSHIPGENMIWADRSGNIGWQVVGIAPVRNNWSGLVPVPGDGRFEWDGYLPIKSLPSVFNPTKGYWVTANENLVPNDFTHRNAVGWEWADSSRANRINEVLSSRKVHTQEDMMKLQFDYLSIPARRLIPLLKMPLPVKNDEIKRALDSLTNWDYVLNKSSVTAGLYMAWERRLIQNAYLTMVPEQARSIIKSVSLRRVIDWIEQDTPELKGRENFMIQALGDALSDLHQKLGDDWRNWQYGQPSYHHVLIKHPLSNAVNDSIRALLECGPLPRGGSGSTPGVTGNGDNQTHGASFRMVADLSDWDKTMFTNTPGQSGNVSSTFYDNLFNTWAYDKHFPVYFSRNKIDNGASEKIKLLP
jgi:penicillin amidase